MENLIRLPKSELYDDELHAKPFLYWIQEQVDRISKYANVIIDLQDEAKRSAIAPAKVHECAAKFTEFYIKNIAFKKIYAEFKDEWQKKSNELYNEMYLDIKREVTNHSTQRGMKYAKKEATEKEIKIEMTTHEKYEEYKGMLLQVDEFEKKEDTQRDFIGGISKLDQILSLLQRAANAARYCWPCCVYGWIRCSQAGSKLRRKLNAYRAAKPTKLYAAYDPASD